MKPSGRLVLASASVATFVLAQVLALSVGPDVGPWLDLCVLFAVATCIEAVAADTRALAAAMLLGLPAVVALVAEGSPTWMMGPLGALLLVSGELNALSWKWVGGAPPPGLRRRLLVDSASLAGLGLGASLVVSAVAGAAPEGGTLMVAVAAGAFAGVGAMAFASR